jgi:hypothetical protein
LAQKATVAASREEIHASIHEDSKEVVAINPKNSIKPFKQKRILIAISNYVNCNTRAVQEYLETSSEAKLFVRGRGSSSKTTLIQAAANQSSEMVLLLIQHRAEVNTVNNYGRSPLMEAALFGRINKVKILLQHGADKNS